MKMTKKKVFVAALAICLIAILSFGTLAWFTGTDDITNKFMFADSDVTDPDAVFGVNVYEYDEDGTEYDDDTSETGITYEEVLPGGTYYKEARVENTGLHSQWLRATVTVSGADVFKQYIEGSELSVFDNLNTTNWIFSEVKYEDNNIVYVFYSKAPLAKESNIALFDGIIIPSGLTKEDVVVEDTSSDTTGFAENAFTVDVKAEAIQSEKLPEGVDTAIEAFGLLG